MMAKLLPLRVLAHSLIIARSMASEWLVRMKRGLQASCVSLSALEMVPISAASQRARFWLMASEIDEAMGPISRLWPSRASFSAARRPASGVLSSSPSARRILRPSTPPLALASSTANLTPLITCAPMAE